MSDSHGKSHSSTKSVSKFFLFLYKYQLILSPISIIYNFFWVKQKKLGLVPIISLLSCGINFWVASILNENISPETCCYASHVQSYNAGSCSDPNSQINKVHLSSAIGEERVKCSTFSVSGLAFTCLAIIYIIVYFSCIITSLAQQEIVPSVKWMFDPIIFLLQFTALYTKVITGVCGILASIVGVFLLYVSIETFRIRATYDYCYASSTSIFNIDHNYCTNQKRTFLNTISQFNAILIMLLVAAVPITLGIFAHLISLCKLKLWNNERVARWIEKKK